jgi:hypothetical protein
MAPKPQPIESIAVDEVWRNVPPEEKFEAIAQAQASGVIASVIVVIICSTIAVGLKLKWLMWASIMCSPFIYQFAAGKRWRDIKPRVLLEYLGARSAARRFAFAAKGKDLTCRFMFRGKLEYVFETGAVQEALEAMLSNTKEAAVWVALFGDSVVMMEEQTGGAEAKIAQVLDDKITIEAKDTDGKGSYSSNKELFIQVKNRNRPVESFKLTSNYPAALVVFEKKAQQILKAYTAPQLTVNDSFDKEGGVMMFD